MKMKSLIDKCWNINSKVFSRGTRSAQHEPSPIESAESPAPRSAKVPRDAEKIRHWRRRVLVRRGATLHAQLVAQDSSLAMLDDTGMVISWYGCRDGLDRSPHEVVERPLSQFYVAQDLATEQPLRDLHAATIEGRSVRQGWRLRAEGAAVWATTVIDAIRLGDGRLQGFSCLTTETQRPSDHVPMSTNVDREERSWKLHPARAAAPTRIHRMARSLHTRYRIRATQSSSCTGALAF